MSKRLIRQFFVFVFVIGVASFAYYDYKKGHQLEGKKTEDSYFIKDAKLKDLTQLEIKNPEQTILLVKKKQDWFLQKPIKDLASFKEISRWFKEIQNQKVKEIKLEGDIVWKNYYLENSPQAGLKFANGESIDFSVSSQKSFDDQFFVRQNKKLFLAQKYFFNEVNSKKEESFRNKKLIPGLGHASLVTIKNKKTLQLYWKDYKWGYKNKDFPLDRQRLRGFWDELSSIQSIEFKQRVSATSLKNYGLSNSAKQIHLTYDDGVKVVLKFSPIKNNKIYVYSSYRNYILGFDPEDIKKLFLSKNDIRDHSQAFRFAAEQASSIEFKSKKQTHLLQKKSKKWFVSLGENTNLNKVKDLLNEAGQKNEQPLKNIKTKKQKNKKQKNKLDNHNQESGKNIDLKKVKVLLSTIKELKGVTYRLGAINQPDVSFLIKDRAGNTLLSLKATAATAGKVWIQSNLSKELVAIAPSTWDTILNQHSMLFIAVPNSKTPFGTSTPKTLNPKN